MGLFDSIKGEVKQRIDESKESKKLIRNEQKRLEEKRAKAKKNILRKIKPVDAISSKVEEKHDEKAIAKLEQEEAERLAAERRDRTRELAYSNKRSLAIIALVVIALIICGIGIGNLTKNARLEKQYNEAVQCIIDEDYLKARELLTDLEMHDSKNLIQYAIVMSKAEAYKDAPDVLLRDLNDIGQLENEAIKERHDYDVNQVSMLVNIKKDIEGIDLLNLSAESKEYLDKIGNEITEVDPNWISLINTEEYEKATSLVDSLLNETNIGQLYAAISKLGDITLESDDIVASLIEDYNKLTNSEKLLIVNYSILLEAESKIKQLQKEENERIEKEEQERKKREAEEKAIEIKRSNEANGWHYFSDSETIEQVGDELRVTVDDIPNLKAGDYIEITGNLCWISGSIYEKNEGHILLEAYDSNNVEWEIESMDFPVNFNDLESVYSDIHYSMLSNTNYKKYLVTMRGTIQYVGEGEEGVGHPHGIYFGSSGRIIKIKDTSKD